MDPLSLAIGALLLLIGAILGRTVWAPAALRAERAALQAEPVKTICGCAHAYAMHDLETGHCHDFVKVTRYGNGGGRIGYDRVPCTCRHYTGPKPIDEVFQPRMLPPAD